MRDFVRRKGADAFGTRLRRLSERLDRQVQGLYRAYDVDFEPRWFPVFLALVELGPMSVGDLAARTNVSHAAISQVRGRLVARGLVRVSSHASDQRRQILELTPRGRASAARVGPLWRAIGEATRTLCSESAPRLLAELDGLEAALDRAPLDARVHALLDGKPMSRKRRPERTTRRKSP